MNEQENFYKHLKGRFNLSLGTGNNGDMIEDLTDDFFKRCVEAIWTLTEKQNLNISKSQIEGLLGKKVNEND